MSPCFFRRTPGGPPGFSLCRAPSLGVSVLLRRAMNLGLIKTFARPLSLLLVLGDVDLLGEEELEKKEKKKKKKEAAYLGDGIVGVVGDCVIHRNGRELEVLGFFREFLGDLVVLVEKRRRGLDGADGGGARDDVVLLAVEAEGVEARDDAEGFPRVFIGVVAPDDEEGGAAARDLVVDDLRDDVEARRLLGVLLRAERHARLGLLERGAERRDERQRRLAAGALRRRARHA